MTNKPMGSVCENCPAARRARPRYVLGEGPCTAKLIIIGEAPGLEEEVQGRPFVGKSGKLLNALLKQAGIRRSEVYITNVLKCRPLKKITPEMLECCKPNLLLELAPFTEDTRILAMGGSARDVLLPDLAGKSVTSTVGYWYVNILLTWHPAYVLRNPSAIKELNEDIQRWTRGKRPFLPTEVHFLETAEGVCTALYGYFVDIKPVAIDLETSGYSPFADYVLCVSMSQQEGVGFVFPGHLLNDPKVHIALLRHTYIGHNFKFDSEFLIAQHDIHLRYVFDTMLSHYCMDERRGTHALKYLVSRLWDVFDYEAGMLKKYLKKKSESFALIIERGGREELFTYAATDADYTWRLYELYQPALEERGWLEKPFGILIDAAKMYVEAETRGFRIDMDRLAGLEMRYTDLMADKRAELAEIAGVDDFNPNSFKQASHIMYDVIGFTPPQVRSRGSGSKTNPRTTCTEALEELEKIDTTGFCRGMREYRRINKMRGTYVRRLQQAVERDGDGRFHARIRIHGTVTGRLSSPTIMLIPRRAGRWEGEEYGRWIKDAFVASDGYVLCDADYSQIELRLLGWYSRDRYLREVYESGRDLHNEVSIELWGDGFTKSQRWIAKRFNYAWCYGGSEKSFGEGGDVPQDVAMALVRKYNVIMPEASEWRRNQLKIVQKQGYVETPLGRRRRYPLVTMSNRHDVAKQSINAPIQSLASDLTLISAIRIHNDEEFCTLGGRFLVTVHDSVVTEFPIESARRCAEIVKAHMMDVPREICGDYPMDVDIALGFRWGSTEGGEYDSQAGIEHFLESLEEVETR